MKASHVGLLKTLFRRITKFLGHVRGEHVSPAWQVSIIRSLVTVYHKAIQRPQ